MCINGEFIGRVVRVVPLFIGPLVVEFKYLACGRVRLGLEVLLREFSSHILHSFGACISSAYLGILVFWHNCPTSDGLGLDLAQLSRLTFWTAGPRH
jgi:hypothetical protein